MATQANDSSGGGAYVPNTPGSVGVDLSQPSLGTNSGSTDASGSGSTDEVQTFNIADLKFKFNPPIHKDARFVVTDFGEVTPSASQKATDAFYKMKNTYSPGSAKREGEKATKFEGMRLGRIIMDDVAVSKGVIEEGVRHGFRFLYNPTELQGSLNVGTDFIPDQRATNTAVLQQGIENMTFEVLINRIPDVISGAKVSDYLPEITKEDLKRLKAEGTHYDIDHLYRCANGIHDTLSKQRTGDIGVLLPNPCRLILGPYTSRGAVVSVQVNDQMFSADMVPILSYVNIQFARFLNMAQQDMDTLKSYGISSQGEEEDTSGGGGGGSDPDAPELPHWRGNHPQWPIFFGSKVRGTSDWGHYIHKAVCDKVGWADKKGRFTDYYAGASNHGTGRALDIMLDSVNPKNSQHRGWEIANFLRDRAAAYYIEQVIFQQKIWTTERYKEGWRGMSNRGSDNANHYNHVHVSFGPGSGNEDWSKKLSLSTSEEFWEKHPQ